MVVTIQSSMALSSECSNLLIQYMIIQYFISKMWYHFIYDIFIFVYTASVLFVFISNTHLLDAFQNNIQQLSLQDGVNSIYIQNRPTNKEVVQFFASNLHPYMYLFPAAACHCFLLWQLLHT